MAVLSKFPLILKLRFVETLFVSAYKTICRDDVAEWLRRPAHDRHVVGSTLVGTTFHKPIFNSAVRPSEVSK